MPRPSGIAIVEHGSVAIAVAHVEMRGRLNILPRWRNRVAWLSAAEEDVEALMVFVEPGLVSIREWEVDGPRIQQRFTELAVSTDPDALFTRCDLPWIGTKGSIFQRPIGPPWETPRWHISVCRWSEDTSPGLRNYF